MTEKDLYSLSSYHYDLDESRIAQYPANPADTSRLLVRDTDGGISNRVFYEFPTLLSDSHVLFFNDSKVIRSRIVLHNALLTTTWGKQKTFDGEIFFLDDLGDGRCKCMVYPGDYFPVWGRVEASGVRWHIEEVVYEGRVLRIGDDTNQDCRASLRSARNDGTRDIWDILESHGQLPLPPYIEYDRSKESGYQTVFADKRGSLAAPTASLHFTPRILDALDARSITRHTVTLHVGLGTFKNIYTPDIRDYEMHAERIEIPLSLFATIARIKADENILLAVGTTVARTLESLPYLYPLVRDRIDRDASVDEYWDRSSDGKNPEHIVSGVSIDTESGTIRFSSQIFIYPGFSWRVVDELVTNFHLPSSTLFMLVSSRLGLDETLRIYEHAKTNDYRFFSFGDAMWLRK